MIWEINKLMDSHVKICRDLGKLLYHKEGEGLSEKEVERLLEIVNNESIGKIFDRGFEKGRSLGYYEGYGDEK